MFTSIAKKWRKQYKIKIQIEASTNNGLMEYHIFDREDEEISP
ncbi:MAG: hypothetical protein ACKO66_07075 [Flavobacteriales bacterium]